MEFKIGDHVIVRNVKNEICETSFVSEILDVREYTGHRTMKCRLCGGTEGYRVNPPVHEVVKTFSGCELTKIEPGALPFDEVIEQLKNTSPITEHVKCSCVLEPVLKTT